VGNKKSRSLVTFLIACLYSLVAVRVLGGFMETHYSDIPNYAKHISTALVLGPLYWAGFKFMDAWKQKSK